MMLNKGFFTALSAILILTLPVACSAGENGPQRYLAGEHYTVLDESVTADTGNKIEVIEFFLYGCSHCNAFDPAVSAWVAKAPEDVEFRRVPVTFTAIGPLFARMFYTARDLGVLEQLHSTMFAAIHAEHRDLTAPEKIRAFFVENGVDGKKFDASFNSDKVKAQVKQATERMRAYRIDGVPAMAVNGQFTVNGRQADSNDDMPDVVDFLIKKVRTSR